MKRREFIAGLSGTCVWPLAGYAQHLELRRVGVLVGGAEKDPEQVSRLAAFQRSLRDFGWIEGRNFKIDVRYTPGDENRTQTIARELIELRPDVILAATTTVASTVQKATSTIPIVFVVVSDPIGSGLVQNLPRPGANVTGFLNIEASLGGKWLELLREIAPRTTRAAMMFNPDSAPQFEYYWRSFESAARNLGVETATAHVRNDGDIEAAIGMLGRQSGNGLIVMPDFFASAHRKQIISQANRHRVPAVYPYPFFSKDDGLISYGVTWRTHSQCWRLCRPNFERREASRATSASSDQVRTRHQSQDCQDFWAGRTSASPAARRRGDRVMKRREFITLLGGAAAWPLAARAQQAGKTFHIGMVETISAELNAVNLAAFLRGLQDHGYVEGRNLVLSYKSADGDASRFPVLISELINSNVDLIVSRGTPASLAAKKATSTIPVVMAGLGEPLLVVASLARPGGNITGLSGLQPELETKRLELLTEIAPASSGIAALLNMSNPVTAPQLNELERAVRLKGLPFRLFDVRSGEDIERAFSALNRSSDAIVVGLEALTQAHRKIIAELAVKQRLPAIYGGREFVEAGGLIFYGPVSPTCIAAPPPMWTRYFTGPSLPTCRSSSRRSSSLSSTSKRLRPSVSKCRRRCSPAPTR